MIPLQNNGSEPKEIDLSEDFIGLENIGNVKKQISKRERAHKRDKKRKTSKVIIVISLTLLGIILALMITAFTLILIGKNQMLKNQDASIEIPETVVDVAPEDEGKIIKYKGKTYELNKNITSILCMGVDKNELGSSQSYGANGQADANFLLVVDTKSGRVSAIAINRDTMVEVNSYSSGGEFLGTKSEQLCLGFAAGDGKEKSCENMVKSVSNLFYGIPISSYIAIDLKAIGILNDALGNNISVVSPDSFYSSMYGVSFTKGKETVLDSPQKAAAFVRHRDITQLDSNVTRMQRQKQYLQKFATTSIVQTKKDITFPITLYNIISDYNVNNINVSKISYLTSCVIGGMKNPKVDFLSIKGELKEAEVLSDGERKAEFHVDEEALFELILDVYYVEKADSN